MQQGSARPSTNALSVSNPKDAAERQADAAAESMARGAVTSLAPVFAAPSIQRQLLDPDAPSTEAPGLSNATVDAANAHLRQREWQEALDVIVDEPVRKAVIDRSLLEGGRMHFQGVGGEGLTTPSGFRRTPAGGLKTLRHPLRLDRLAFNRGLPWLYRTIQHEYHHVLQLKDPRGLPTTETAVPGQAADRVLIDQQEAKTYADVILQAHLTGEFAHPRDIREDWGRGVLSRR